MKVVVFLIVAIVFSTSNCVQQYHKIRYGKSQIFQEICTSGGTWAPWVRWRRRGTREREYFHQTRTTSFRLQTCALRTNSCERQYKYSTCTVLVLVTCTPNSEYCLSVYSYMYTFRTRIEYGCRTSIDDRYYVLVVQY
jgi:hypothetical protein